MTTFDELIGSEPDGEERARLRNVHELLLEAGPPPELHPDLESGPTLAMTLGRRRRARRPRRMLIAAVVAAAALVALIVGLSTSGGTHSSVIPLHGTAAAPNAKGGLNVTPPRTMLINVQGLGRGLYGVYVASNGRPSLKCGSFRVTNAHTVTTATLTSPYRLRARDTWVVTRQRAGGEPGVIVLRPSTT